MNLKNKTILITGASKGIGKQLAIALDKKEAKLILVARTEKLLEELIKSLSGDHKYLICDLTNPNSIDELTEKVIKEQNQIDILINSAGIGIYKNLEETKFEDWDKSFDLNARAPFLLTQGLLLLLEKSSDSIVINIGSGAGTMGMRGRSLYCASKFALRGLTLSLREKFEGRNPTFTLITLGSTLTDFGPMELSEKRKAYEGGKAYFEPEFVADRLVEILESDKPDEEYVLYPSEFGRGEWKKP